MDLDNQSHGDVLVCNLLVARHRRDEGDAVVQVWRNSQYSETGLYSDLLRNGGNISGFAITRDTVANICLDVVEFVRGRCIRLRPVKLAHRCAEVDIVAQALGKS